MKKTIFILIFLIKFIYPQEMELIGVRGNTISSLAKSGNHLFVGTSYNGLYYTSDTAIVRCISIPKDYSDINFRTSEIDTNLFLFGSGFFQFRSTDACLSWNIFHKNNNYENGLGSKSTINPLNPNSIYNIRDGNEIWKSNNKGESWQLICKFNKKIFLLEYAPSDTNFMYCSADNSVYLSTNSGKDWVKKLMDTSRAITALAVNPLNKNTIYFSHYDEVYKSYSNGSDPLVTITSDPLNKIDINPIDTNIVYITGFRYSTNGGETFHTFQNGLPINKRKANILIDPKNPSIIYAGTDNFGVYKTYDGGNNWFQTNLSYNSQYDMHFISKDSFLVSEYSRGIWKTTNYGESWYNPNLKIIKNSDYDFSTKISFSPHLKNIGIVGWYLGYPQRTTDYGETWDTLKIGIESFDGVQPLFSPYIEGLVFLCGSLGRLGGNTFTYKSTDYGLTWNKVSDESFTYMYFDPNDSNTVYSMKSFENTTIFKSTDLGNNWITFHSSPLNSNINDFVIDKNGTILYTFFDYVTGTGKIMASYNDGISWEDISAKLKAFDPVCSVHKIALVKNKPGRFFVSLLSRNESFTNSYTNGGVYLTDNYGEKWRKIYDSHVFPINIDDETPASVYLGTKYGIMRFVDTLSVTAVENEELGENKEYFISQNYPNPFNPTTTIKYSIPESGLVTIKVFDLLGREIRTLIREEKQTGRYEVTFNADGLPSGIYLYSIQAGKFSETRKMLLVK